MIELSIKNIYDIYYDLLILGDDRSKLSIMSTDELIDTLTLIDLELFKINQGLPTWRQLYALYNHKHAYDEDYMGGWTRLTGFVIFDLFAMHCEFLHNILENNMKAKFELMYDMVS